MTFEVVWKTLTTIIVIIIITIITNNNNKKLAGFLQGWESRVRKRIVRQSVLTDLSVTRVTGDNRWNSCSELLSDANSSLIPSGRETRVFCSEVGEFHERLKHPKAQRKMNLSLPLAYRHLWKEWQLLPSIIMVSRKILFFVCHLFLTSFIAHCHNHRLLPLNYQTRT